MNPICFTAILAIYLEFRFVDRMRHQMQSRGGLVLAIVPSLVKTAYTRYKITKHILKITYAKETTALHGCMAGNVCGSWWLAFRPFQTGDNPRLPRARPPGKIANAYKGRA